MNLRRLNCVVVWPALCAFSFLRASRSCADEPWPDFQVSDSSLPAAPHSTAPKPLRPTASTLDLGQVDTVALEKYEATVKLEKVETSPEKNARSWRRLAKEAPAYAALGTKRAAEWDAYAAQKKAAEDAKRKRMLARNLDWKRLSRLLALGEVPEPLKQRWSESFLEAYVDSPGIDPASAGALAEHLPPSQKYALEELMAKPAPFPAQRAVKGQEEIEWVRIPGGSFMMGSQDQYNAKPVHRVAVRAFEMAKTLVTNKQYKACVDAGVCAPPDRGCLIFGFRGDDQPVVCVDWQQAKTFSEWVGGRLPSEAEWEYAARGAGKDRKYPWGNEESTCQRAIMFSGQEGGCGHQATWPVCSKPAGNTEQGLCDMAGNAFEWVQDWYHGSYDGAPTDASPWESPAGSLRVRRGGTWSLEVADTSAAARFGFFPGRNEDRDVSFRPVR